MAVSAPTRSAFAWYIFHGTINLERLRRDGPGPLEAGRRLLNDVLPPPPVRAKLRLAAGLTQQEVAEVVGVKRVAVARWELGQTYPRRPHRAVYLHLLNRLAERFPRPRSQMRACRRRSPKGDRDDLEAIGHARLKRTNHPPGPARPVCRPAYHRIGCSDPSSSWF
ncbi:hypothetical protein Shyd_72540 [Streptomyces hydrogenans]|uniref:HTH cro/C1-type domain-containing protein n=1 Tax=Streptomyces hydrogenans TaxID=1873719 RepID=A0ABQ3PLI0_9ACTN|nr:hypothetical protein Shyd_72540 [Streptomyces hydrogenans]